jgi:hypothetical protein
MVHGSPAGQKGSSAWGCKYYHQVVIAELSL